MKLAWMLTDRFGNVTLHDYKDDYLNGVWVRIGYFEIDGGVK